MTPLDRLTGDTMEHATDTIAPKQSATIRIEAQGTDGSARRITYEFTYRGNLSASEDKTKEIQVLTELLRRTLTAIM